MKAKHNWEACIQQFSTFAFQRVYFGECGFSALALSALVLILVKMFSYVVGITHSVKLFK